MHVVILPHKTIAVVIVTTRYKVLPYGKADTFGLRNVPPTGPTSLRAAPEAMHIN